MKVLVAYDNDAANSLHGYFETCADDAKQWCIQYGHDYTNACPPELNEAHVIPPMMIHDVCFVAAHGDAYGIYNTDGDDIVSTHTTNYNLSEKIFYAVSCRCAQHLMPMLKGIGTSIFVGYDDDLIVVEGDDLFRVSAMSGLERLLAGETINVARQKMIEKYNESITSADSKDKKKFLLHNREHLCFK